jgi:hypothetical protein
VPRRTECAGSETCAESKSFPLSNHFDFRFLARCAGHCRGDVRKDQGESGPPSDRFRIP